MGPIPARIPLIMTVPPNVQSQATSVSVDTVQAFWDARPCNIRHSLKPVGTKEYFDEVERRKYFVEPHILEFAQFERWRGKKVLEVGCGIGTDTINFARAGAQVTAVDLSERSLAVARQRAQVFELTDRVRFFQANAEQLTSVVPADGYDLIYSFGVIRHTPHPPQRHRLHPSAHEPGVGISHDGVRQELLEADHDRCGVRSTRGAIRLSDRFHVHA